jgi:hypothetical protein
MQVVVCSAADVCCVYCAFIFHHGSLNERGEERRGDRELEETFLPSLRQLSRPLSSSRRALLVRSSEYRESRTSPFFSQKMP